MKTPSFAKKTEKYLIPFPQKKTEDSGLEWAFGEGSTDNKAESVQLAPEPPIVTTPSSCESELTPAVNPKEAEDEEDEDQTIFYTPEGFNGEEETSSTLKETKTESPSRMTLGAESPVLLSQELFSPEPAQGQASASDGQSVASVGEEEAELPLGQREERRGQTQCGEEEQVGNQSRQTGRGLHRLSRSRQKASSPPSGN